MGRLSAGALVATWPHAYDYVTVGVIHRNPVIRLPEFLIGIILYRALQEPSLAQLAERYRYCLIAVGLSGLLIGAWLLQQDGRRWFYLVHNGLLTPFQGLLLLACATFRAPESASLQQLARRLGEASLCIFAIHTPMISLIDPWTRHLLAFFTQAQEAASDAISDAVSDVLGDVVTIPLWSLIPHLIVVIGLGLLIQRFLIGPLRRWLEAHLPQKYRKGRGA